MQNKYYILLNLLNLYFSTRIEIIEPKTLSLKLKTIDVSLANFGDIPWGRKLRIDIIKLPDSNELGCTPIPPITQQFDALVYVLVRRGDCLFSEKVKNVQQAGGKGVIIYNKLTLEQSIESIVMSEQGQDPDIRIPSMLITKGNGEAIAAAIEPITTNVVEPNADINIKPNIIKALLSQDSIPKQQVVKQEMIINPLDPNMLRFFKNWQPVYQLIKQDTIFTPTFFFQQLQEAYKENFQTDKYKEVCLSGGRQCAMPIQNENGSNEVKHRGVDIIQEILRMTCLIKASSVDVFMEQIYTISTTCPDNWDTSCAHDALIRLGYFNMVMDCQNNSFKGKNMFLDDNELLRMERDYFYSKNTPYYPAVIVNDMVMRGNIDKIDIFDEICGSMLERKAQCDAIIAEDDPLNWSVEVESGMLKNPLGRVDSTRIIQVAVGVALLVLLVSGQAVWLCCVKSRVKKLMDDEIHTALNKQFEFNNRNDDINNWDQ